MANATLISGCAEAGETVAQTSDMSTLTTTGSTTSGIAKPGTTSPVNNKAPIEAPDYDPQSVQPNGLQLSNAQVRKAVNVALEFKPVEMFLRRNDFKVSEVRRMKPFRQGGYTNGQDHPRARVTVVLDDPVPLDRSGYKGGVCDFGGASGPVTGMVFNVELVVWEVSTFSPQWNYKDSCV